MTSLHIGECELHRQPPNPPAPQGRQWGSAQSLLEFSMSITSQGWIWMEEEAEGPISAADSAIPACIPLPTSATLGIFVTGPLLWHTGHAIELHFRRDPFGGRISHLCLPAPVSCWHAHDYRLQFQPPIYLYQTTLSDVSPPPGSIAVSGTSLSEAAAGWRDHSLRAPTWGINVPQWCPCQPWRVCRALKPRSGNKLNPDKM